MTAKRKKFTPIELHVKDPKDVFEAYREEIAKAIVEAINHNLNTRKKTVDFAQIIIKELLVITLSIDKREFEDLLEEQLNTLIEFEDYETCALIMKLKEKYNKKSVKL
jgi:hypothetical protein